MKPVCTVEREDNFDVRGFGRRILDGAIENLKHDGELQAAAFVVTSKELHCLEIHFQDHEEKQQIYSQVVQFARDHKAEAIVMLNDAYYGEPEDAVDYYPGKLQELGRKEMIQVAVTGPQLTNWSVGVKYERNSSHFLFQMPEEETGGSINVLGDWAANIKSVN